MRTLPGHPNQLDPRSRWVQRFYARTARMALLPSAMAYNLTISHSHRFVWFRVAKVGTRSILAHFANQGVKLDVEHAMSVHYPVNRLGGYFKFAFVRNPFDRLVSCWYNKSVESNYFRFDPQTHHRLSSSFSEFAQFVCGLDLNVGDPHLRLQSRLIDLCAVDFIGRHERFTDDFGELCARLGIPSDGLPRINASGGRREYSTYYDPALAERVAAAYRRDIQIFGYTF